MTQFIWDAIVGLFSWLWSKISGGFIGLFMALVGLVVLVQGWLTDVAFAVAEGIIMALPATGPGFTPVQFSETPFFVVVNITATLIDIPFLLTVVVFVFAFDNAL